MTTASSSSLGGDFCPKTLPLELGFGRDTIGGPCGCLLVGGLGSSSIDPRDTAERVLPKL
jgi:hypothetical protein